MRIEGTSRTGAVVTIAEVKAFGNITTTTEDTQIQRILNAAISKVEDVSNVSLAVNTLKLYSERLSTFEPLLILPVTSITSVVDSETGTAVDYTLSNDKTRVTFGAEYQTVITYITAASTNEELKQIAIELACAMYDGQDKAVINEIWEKIPR